MQALKSRHVSTMPGGMAVSSPNLHLSHMQSHVVQVQAGLLTQTFDVTVALRHGREHQVSIWVMLQDAESEAGPLIQQGLIRLNWDPVHGLFYRVPAHQIAFMKVGEGLASELANIAAALWSEALGE